MIVLPVGLYTGPLYPGVGEPLRYHSVRIGQLTMTLPDDEAYTVWRAAHRPPARAGQPWTRIAVLQAAYELGVPDPAPILAGYLEDGLVVEVEPGDAVGFAERHRVVPLLLGLGNTPADPQRYGLGLLGKPPLVTVPALTYDLIQWGGIADNVWDVCQAFAAAGREAASTEAEQDPEYVLATFVESLPTLLGAQAVHLDEARRAPGTGLPD
jgi:hypothetical protein